MITATISKLRPLTPSEETLVNYILKHPDKILTHDPASLSESAFVSVSTVYRLLNKLKLNGLNDLKVQLAKELEAKKGMNLTVDINYPVIPEDNHYQAMKKLKTLYNETIEDTLHINSPEVLSAIEPVLKKARSIDLYTSSANIYFAENFKFQMQEIGRNVSVPVDEYIQRLTAANSTPDNLAIVISFGGRGAAVQKILNILKENQTPILLISSGNETKLDAYSDYRLSLSPLENHYNKMSSFSTRMSLLYLLDSLYAICFNTHYAENVHYKLTNYKKINHSLE